MPYKSRKTPSSRENSHIRPIAVIWVKELRAMIVANST